MTSNQIDIARTDTGLKISNTLNMLKGWSDLTELESSLMMYCLLKAQDNQTVCHVDELKYFLPENLYCRTPKRLYEVATKMLNTVAHKTIQIQLPDDNYIVIDHIPSLFSKFRTYQDKKGGLERIEFTFNPYALPLIRNLKTQYTLLELRDYFCLKGKHAKRLYTLLRQFKGTGYFEQPIDSFKDLMGCGKEYPISMFRKRVLDPAMSELCKVNESLKERIVNNYVSHGYNLSEEEIKQKEEDGAFFLFYNLKLELIKPPHSKKIEKIRFTFAPQDPKLNHEENLRRYKLKAQQPSNNENGQPVAQTKREQELKKQNIQLKEENTQLKAQLGKGHLPTNTLQQEEDPAVHRPASLYRAEQSSLCAQGVSPEQFHQMAQSVQSQQKPVHPQQLVNNLGIKDKYIGSPSWIQDWLNEDIPLPEEE